jgi:hypothetical protein
VTSDAVLVLAWLVLAHLLADFVLQTDGIATRKFGPGPEAWRALGVHGAVVAAVHLPIALAFGIPSLAFGLVTVVAHVVIDRTKVVLTRRVEPVSPPGVTPSAEDAAEGPAFDRAWSGVPGGLFALDQAAHLVVLAAGWLVFLAGATPVGLVRDGVDALLRGTDRVLFHDAVLTAVVLTSLLIVNVRAGSLFVATLVRPPQGRDAAGRPPSARVGAVIGVLERLLICTLVLAGAVASIGLVIAAKTLARFKQLDDREFAEYYLLGTLASVAVAVASSLVAQAALAVP